MGPRQFQNSGSLFTKLGFPFVTKTNSTYLIQDIYILLQEKKNIHLKGHIANFTDSFSKILLKSCV